MISAAFKINKQHQFVSLEVSGHAMAGEYGSDVVCAGVSAIVIGLVNNLSRMAQITPAVEMDDEEGGYLYIELPATLAAKQQEMAQLLFESCYLILKEDIEPNYGEYVQVKQIN